MITRENRHEIRMEHYRHNARQVSTYSEMERFEEAIIEDSFLNATDYIGLHKLAVEAYWNRMRG